MRRIGRMLLAVLALALVALVVALPIGAWRQRRTLASDRERLVRAGAASGEALVDPRALDQLPAPVARYLRLAIPDVQRLEEVRIRQTGTLRTDPGSERWMAFEAEQIIVPPAAGFLWNARVRVAPLVHVRVRDTLIEGVGSGQVALMSAFVVSAATGSPEMNAGSLHRYLAEAVWYPTALLPGPNLRWTAIDATKALATLTSHGVSVSLEFRFAPTGEVTGIYTPARWGTFSGGFRQVPWEGHFRDYRNRDGVVVPGDADVGWYVDGQWRPVWKGTVVGYEARTRR